MPEKKSKSCNPRKKKWSGSLRRNSTKSSALRTAPLTMKRENGASGYSTSIVTPYPVKTQGFHHFLILLFYDHPPIAELFLFMCRCCILKRYSIPIFQGGRRL